MCRWLACLSLSILLLAGCATPVPPPAPPPPPVVVIPAPEPTPPPPLPETLPEPRNDKLKHLANRKLAPIPDRPLNARASCAFRDVTGYRGRLRLDVREANVRRFEANIDVPKQGSCKFDLKNFHQTDTLPIVVLAARRGDCKVRLWEQEDQVTVAFRDCHTECSGSSVEYIWPILVDNRKGLCS